MKTGSTARACGFGRIFLIKNTAVNFMITVSSSTKHMNYLLNKEQEDDSTDPPLGTQLTVKGSDSDFFYKFRDVSLINKEYRVKYDELKRSYEGKDSLLNYRAGTLKKLERYRGSNRYI